MEEVDIKMSQNGITLTDDTYTSKFDKLMKLIQYFCLDFQKRFRLKNINITDQSRWYHQVFNTVNLINSSHLRALRTNIKLMSRIIHRVNSATNYLLPSVISYIKRP